MGFGVKLIVSGDYALFSRPELKVERVSYDVPTPSAMVGLLSSIYWHPGVKYKIDEIRVYNEIQFLNLRKNEVNDKLSYADVQKKMKGTKSDISIYTSELRTQRANLLLKDVSYGIEAHFELTDEKMEDMDEKKCYNILLRRLKKGQYFTAPCLGCREFGAKVVYVEGKLPDSELEGDVDLGYMLYDLQYQKDENGKATDFAEPRFYRPHMVNGVIDVGKYSKEGDILC